MKKISYYFAVFAICVAIFSVNSCKKSKDVLNGNCDELSNAYIAAYQAYIMNPTVENCEAWVDALEDYVNGCAILTPAERQEFQESIDEADCSN